MRFPIGTNISKQFEGPNGPYYDGTIISYDTQRKFYQIKYTDGDREDFTHEEVHSHQTTTTQTSTSSANESINGGKRKRKNDKNWNEKFKRLVLYKKKNKHTNVSRNEDLGSWVTTQRRFYKDNKLAIDRIEKMDDIGFVWDPYDAAWTTRYEELKLYKKQNDNSTNVSTHYEENHNLGYWVQKQRKANKQKKLSGKRIELLNLIDFF